MLLLFYCTLIKAVGPMLYNLIKKYSGCLSNYTAMGILINSCLLNIRTESFDTRKVTAKFISYICLDSTVLIIH